MKKLLQPQTGFTLIELVTSIGLFSIALLIMVGVYTRFIAVERRDIGEQTLQEELRVALELFDREARTAFASSYALEDGTGQSLVMRNQNGLCVHYRLNEDTHQIERAESSVTSEECLNITFNPEAYAPITSAAIVIEQLFFDVLEPDQILEGEELIRQGFITLRIKAATRNNLTAPLELQTTVTSRQVIPYEQVSELVN